MLIPIKYNLRYLVTRWTGTLMTGLTFGLVVAVFVIIMSLANGIERALTTEGNPLNVLILRQGAQAEGQSSVQLDQFQVIRNYAGIAKDQAGEPLIAPEVQVLMNKERFDGAMANLQIRGVHAQAFRIRPEVRIVEGRAFQPGMREAIVSRRISQRFKDMKIGQTPQLGRGRWTVVGYFEADGTPFDSEMWADYQELMQEFDRATYNTVVLRALDKAAIDSIRKLVEDDPRIKLKAKSEVEYYAEQMTMAAPLKAFGTFLAIIMAVGACFAGMNTMYASVANRIKEIGTLRILGYTPRSVLLSFWLESILLACVGGVLGCLMALPVNALLARNPMGTAGSFHTFSEVVFYFTVTPDIMVQGIIFALVMGTFGGLLPAVSAARQPILKALRNV